MMNGSKKSDLAKVAGKPTNKAGQRTAVEPVEPRAGAEGNANQQGTHRTQCRARVSQALERVRQAAKARKKERFTALLHHVNIDLLRLSFYALKRSAAQGVDGVTWQDYESDLESRLQGLHKRVHGGAYRAWPSRRKYAPKPDGRQRPLGIAALEDKIPQRAVVAVLNAIYEEDFLGFSYGFRPKRSQHDALDALMVGIQRRKNVLVDLLHQQTLAADRVQHLHHQRPQQPLRCDRRPPPRARTCGRTAATAPATLRPPSSASPATDDLSHPLLRTQVAEHLAPLLVVSAHAFS